jgi:hypothetical protein
MGGINVARWLSGGVAAGLVIGIVEGLASLVYGDRVQAMLAAHDLALVIDAGTVALGLLASLLVGLALTFFYATARARFGPGPRTAVIVAVVFWAGGYVMALVGSQMLGLFTGAMLVAWGAVGLVELVLASLAGGWVYREGP